MKKTYTAEITWRENDHGDVWNGIIMGVDEVIGFSHQDAVSHKCSPWVNLFSMGDTAFMRITKRPDGLYHANFQARSRFARQSRVRPTLAEAQEAVSKWARRKFRKEQR